MRYRRLSGEEFREIFLGHKTRVRYAVSSFGRILSFSREMTDGKILKGGERDGYRVLPVKVSDDESPKSKVFFVGKLVAEAFLERPSPEHTYVLHLDYKRSNDRVENLKFATYQEMLDHGNQSPHVREARKKLIQHNIKSDGRKLTVANVIKLKKILADPNRKIKLRALAKQFNISEMQLFRIKKGENWGHIEV